ncbi:hypothetical protein [Lysinibacillus sp. NPDC059133]|uniref:hypothetical protein n=1 Tax=Lysinibacillus sp. NPDC059133 TaxID=3346737 RepID=UPI00368CEBDB
MQLTDGAWMFDTEDIDSAIKKSEHNWYERDMLNAFTRYTYYRYKQIRDCVNSRKCKYMTVDEVREQLAIESKLSFTTELLSITADEVHYIVDYADEHLEYIK